MKNKNRFSGIHIGLVFCLVLSGLTAALAANPAHLKLLAETGNCENCDLSGTDFSGQKLVDSNLAGANLEGSNFSGADLTNAYLSNTNLKNANLQKSILIHTKFFGADLTGADLRHARIQSLDANSSFFGVNLTNAKMQGVEIDSGADIDSYEYNSIRRLDVDFSSFGKDLKLRLNPNGEWELTRVENWSPLWAVFGIFRHSTLDNLNLLKAPGFTHSYISERQREKTDNWCLVNRRDGEHRIEKCRINNEIWRIQN